jgi:biotin transporter BioY
MTIFDDLKQSFANLIGTDVTTAGYILAFVLIIVVIITLEWAIDRDGKARTATFLASVGIGIVFSAMFGLIPLWVPFVMGMVLVLILVHPFGGETMG